MKRYLIFLSMLFGYQQLPAHTSPVLQPYIWEYRVLIIFTPSALHPKYEKQLQELKKVQEGLIDRDLFIIKNYKGNTIFADERLLTKAENHHLRKHFNLSPKTFTVILVGKDGTKKLKTNKILTSKKLFAVIDAMPMRREEMKAKH